ncbi:hypothetical protein NVP1031O_143 [Vibrio phage 1.031.O._10N.261.46.F8]|nr:hypothetical protein NVP1031O_143 [Vibrio phage 1.031.O._10N.261.46.F8]
MTTTYKQLADIRWIAAGDDIEGSQVTPAGSDGRSNEPVADILDNTEYLRVRTSVLSPLLEPEAVNTSFTAVKDVAYLLTVSPNITVTFPTAPTKGDSFRVKMVDGDPSTSVLLDGNGNKISKTATKEVNANYFNMLFVYDGVQWAIASGGGATGEGSLPIRDKVSIDTTVGDSDINGIIPVQSAGTGTITMTLPATPAIGTTVGFVDYDGNWANGPLRVTSTGNIAGGSDDIVVQRADACIVMQYVDATQGWKLVYGTPSHGEVDWVTVTSDSTLIPGIGHWMDTSALTTEPTITLPATPSKGMKVGFGDYTGNFGVRGCTVALNGNNFMGQSEDLLLETSNVVIVAEYVDATIGWKIISGVGLGSGVTQEQALEYVQPIIQDWATNTFSNTNLLSNHNFLLQTPDDSQPLPSATPTTYPAGHQIFSGVFANDTTGITDLTYIDGRVAFSSGDLYFAVPNTGGIERLAEFAASVADFDGKPRTRGVSFALVGDDYRVTVSVDALEDTAANLTPIGSVKFEQGSVATGHNVSLGGDVISEVNDVSDLLKITTKLGQTLTVKNRARAKFSIESSGSGNGYDSIPLDNSFANLIIEPAMGAGAWGISPTNATNHLHEQAMINNLKAGGCKVITYPAGVLNYQCDENLTRGSACFEYRDIEGVEFLGGIDTTVKLIEGGSGASAFYLARFDKNSRDITRRGIRHDGQYSTTPNFQGQGGNRNGAYIIAGWDFVPSTQDSYDDYSVGGHKILNCCFDDIGGAFATTKKSLNTFRSGFLDSCEFKGNICTDAQQANNTVGGDFAVSWKVTDNVFKTTIPLSDTVWTLAVDISRGCIGCEVARNKVSNYHYGIKSEYALDGGIGANEIVYSELTEIHNNILLQIGHPTLDLPTGPNALGSYGIRMSGTNVVERDNVIVGLNNPAASEPKRLVFGVFANQQGVQTSIQDSVRGRVENAQYGVVHNSSNGRNTYKCKRKTILDIKNAGVILHAGGTAEKNHIGRIGGPGINLQVADQTFAIKNYIFYSMQDGGSGGAIFQEQNAANAKYFEVIENEVIRVDGGSGTGFSSVAGSANRTPFRFVAGRTVDATISGAEYVSDVRDGDPIKATGLVNPQTLALLESRNIDSISRFDSTTVQINFKKPMPNSLYSWDARNQNDASVWWIGYGSTDSYLRLRSVDVTNTPVVLPSSLMITVF